MDELEPRVRAVCDLNVAEAREEGGRHEYDGLPQDLSPDGVAAGLARLAAAARDRPALSDPHDEAHLRAFEELQQVMYGDLELHRSNPMYHLGELDLACYDKDYAPEAERHAARRASGAGRVRGSLRTPYRAGRTRPLDRPPHDAALGAFSLAVNSSDAAAVTIFSFG